MTSTLTPILLILSASFLMTSSVFASPAQNFVKRSVQEYPSSPHMQIADRLLKRVLDITYETLQDLGASRDDLERVQQKRSYIQACYFQAISCY